MYSAARHVAQMFSALGPPKPELLMQRGQVTWKWSPPIENQYGELCEDACSFYNGPFFDPVTGMFLVSAELEHSLIVTRPVPPSGCTTTASGLRRLSRFYRAETESTFLGLSKEDADLGSEGETRGL